MTAEGLVAPGDDSQENGGDMISARQVSTGAQVIDLQEMIRQSRPA